MKWNVAMIKKPFQLLGWLHTIYDADENWIATTNVSNDKTDEERADIAAHIVRCVNSFDDLVAALESAQRTLQAIAGDAEDWDDKVWSAFGRVAMEKSDQICELLSKARGEQ